MRLGTGQNLKAIPPFWFFGFGLWWVWWPSIGMHSTSVFPATEQVPQLLRTSHVALYVALAVSCALVALFARKSGPIHRRPRLIVASLALSSAGVIVMSLSGLGYIGLEGLTIGSVIMGLSSVPLAIAWLELLKSTGTLTAVITFSGSAPVAAALYYAIVRLGRVVPLAMVVALAALPWVSYAMLGRAWGSGLQHKKVVDKERNTDFRLPGEIMVGVFIYGLAYGLMLSLTTAIPRTQSFTFVTLGEALGVGLAGLLFMVGVLFAARAVNLGLIYQPAPPLVILGFLLLQVFGSSDPFITGIVAVAGYSYFQIFTLSIFSDIANRLPVPARFVAGQGLFVDNLGVALGMVIQIVFIGPSVTAQQISWISISAFLILMVTSLVTFGERKVLSLWGLSAPEASAASAGCQKLGEMYGLTARELEILTLLARGHNVEHIQHELVLSVWTVRTHVRRIYEKMDVHTRQQLIDLVDRECKE